MIKHKLISTVTLLAFALTALSPPVYAHGGGLNSNGCHNETATGGYHCHQEEKSKGTYGIVSLILIVLLIPALMKKSESSDNSRFLETKQGSKSHFQLIPYSTNNSGENSKGNSTGLILEYKF
jgi:hypothetical protein